MNTTVIYHEVGNALIFQRKGEVDYNSISETVTVKVSGLKYDFHLTKENCDFLIVIEPSVKVDFRISLSGASRIISFSNEVRQRVLGLTKNIMFLKWDTTDDVNNDLIQKVKSGPVKGIKYSKADAAWVFSDSTQF